MKGARGRSLMGTFKGSPVPSLVTEWLLTPRKYSDPWSWLISSDRHVVQGPLPTISVHIVNNQLCPWNWVLLEKPPVTHLLKNFPKYYGTWKIVILLTGALHWSLPWARWIQSIPPQPISRRFILILSSRVRLGLFSVLFLLTFAPKFVSCLSHPPWIVCSDSVWQRLDRQYAARRKVACSIPDEVI
jgi:hypothetical protein